MNLNATSTAWDLGRDITYEVLIANLGGYEAAKRYAESRNGADNTGVYDSLQAALLEYRRQHKIFEVGDKVVLAQFHSLDTVHEIKRIENLTPHIKGSETTYFLENSLGCWSFQIKHATDEEIKAGKRLEVV